MVRNITIAALLGAALAGAVHAAPDLVIHNGKLYSADSERSVNEAMAVTGNQIVALGSSESMLALADDSTRLVDLGGRLVLPGLHDAHIHVSGIVDYEGCNIDSRAMNLAEISAFVGECMERLKPPAEEWLTVRQWAFSDGNRPAGEFKTIRQALDAVTGDTPVVLLGNDGHHNATNSAGLARARNSAGEKVGLSADSLAGEFSDLKPFVGVDADGEPTGAVNEHAIDVLGGPTIMTADLSLIIANADQVAPRLNSLGITSIQDAAVMEPMIGLFDGMLAQDEMPLRIRLAQWFVPQLYMDDSGKIDMAALLQDAEKLRDYYADEPRVNAGALKFFVDGVLEGNPLTAPPTLPNAALLKHYHQPRIAFDEGSGELNFAGYVALEGDACVAWRSAPEGDPMAFKKANGFHPGQCQISNGELVAPVDVVNDFLLAADKADYAVHLHAIGDRAVRVGIDAVEGVTPEKVETNRHSMTHLQLVADEEIARLGKLKIPLAMTYAWAARSVEYDWMVVPFIERLKSPDHLYDPESYLYRNSYPNRAIRDAGGVLAAGSDAPVDTDDPRPFINMEVAITRDRGEGPYNPDQALNVYDAIEAYTINGARLLGQQDELGSLEVGKIADFIVLDRNIIELANSGKAGEIGATRVLQTWFDGELVYEVKQ